MGIGKVIKKTVKTVTNVGKNIVDSSTQFTSDMAHGRISKGLLNVPGIATWGAIDTSGRKKGLINMDAGTYMAGLMGGMGVGAATTGTSYKGLLTQLRQGKGKVGGGSYSEVATNPLGGTSGKTGA